MALPQATPPIQPTALVAPSFQPSAVETALIPAQNGNAASTEDANSVTPAPMCHWHKLPTELNRRILQGIARPCTVCRHVVEWLNALFGFTATDDRPPSRQADVYKDMRPYESEIVRNMLQLRLVSTEKKAALPTALRGWLSQLPMSPQDFEEARVNEFEIWQYKSLVLEVFSLDDLLRIAHDTDTFTN